MARQALVTYVLTCDVDGEEIPPSEADDVTRTVSFDGGEYTVDLCGLHRGELDDVLKAMKVFVDAGQRTSRRAKPKAPAAKAPAAKAPAEKSTKRGRAPVSSARRSQSRAQAEIAAIRAWAQANGHKVGDRGRIPAAVVMAYANRDSQPAAPAAPKRRPRKPKVAAVAE